MGKIEINEKSLTEHSFDLVHFPLYLERNVAANVQLHFVENSKEADLVGYFRTEGEGRISRFVKLDPETNGISTRSEDFYHAVHAAFQAVCPQDTKYLGFTRCGPPAYAPMFALAIAYKKYGRGIYEPGKTLPTPCSFLNTDYAMVLR